MSCCCGGGDAARKFSTDGAEGFRQEVRHVRNACVRGRMIGREEDVRERRRD